MQSRKYGKIYSFCKLQLMVEMFGDTQLNELTKQKSIKVDNVVESTKKKTLYKTLGTSVINSPLPPCRYKHYDTISAILNLFILKFEIRVFKMLFLPSFNPADLIWGHLFLPASRYT